jgi:hypothetical protein
LEEDVKIVEEIVCSIWDDTGCDVYLGETERNALNNLLTRYKLYEQKLMFALAPTTHELALETQRNFKKIIAENINEDTYTIKRELKKYWNNMDTYWKEE